MNKRIGILTSLFLVTYVVSIEVLAKTDNKAIDLNKINKSNHALLFKSVPNIVVLNKEEMKDTEGEFWGRLLKPTTLEAPTLNFPNASFGSSNGCSNCHSESSKNYSYNFH